MVAGWLSQSVYVHSSVCASIKDRSQCQLSSSIALYLILWDVIFPLTITLLFWMDSNQQATKIICSLPNYIMGYRCKPACLIYTPILGIQTQILVCTASTLPTELSSKPGLRVFPLISVLVSFIQSLSAVFKRITPINVSCPAFNRT